MWYVLKMLWHHLIYFESAQVSFDIFWKCFGIMWYILKVLWHHVIYLWKCSGIMWYVLKVLRHRVISFESVQASCDKFWKCSGIVRSILKVLRYCVISFESALTSCDIFWKCSGIMWYILKVLWHHVICFESVLTSCDMFSRVGAVCAILVSLNNSTALRGIQNSSLWKIASLLWNYMFHDKMCRNYECCHSLILSCQCHQCHDVSFSNCHGLSPVHIANKLLSLILLEAAWLQETVCDF